MAVHRVDLRPEPVVVRAWTEEPGVWTGPEALIAQLRDKLLMCRHVAEGRSPFVIRQRDVLLRREPPEKAAP